LSSNVEAALCQLIYAEVELHLTVETLKNRLLHTHDFTFEKAFKSIDDWSYGYIDAKNLKRFLVGMGYRHPLAKKDNNNFILNQFLMSILRRFDLNGDSKISFEEFKQGIDPKKLSYQIKPKEIKHTGYQNSVVQGELLSAFQKPINKKKRVQSAAVGRAAKLRQQQNFVSSVLPKNIIVQQTDMFTSPLMSRNISTLNTNTNMTLPVVSQSEPEIFN
jgi:hypothetical protein